MNWKRGLFRLWLLASLLFPGSIVWNEKEGIGYDCFGPYARASECIDGSIGIAGLSIAASIALLIVGMIALWVVRGFQREVQA